MCISKRLNLLKIKEGGVLFTKGVFKKNSGKNFRKFKISFIVK